RLQAVLDARGEDTPGAKAAVGAYLEDADVGLLGVVDIEEALVRREAEPIGLGEGVALHQQLRLAAGLPRRNAKDALPAQLARPLDPEAGHAPVPGVGEIDRAVGAHAEVVGAVELLALEVGGEHLAAAVG